MMPQADARFHLLSPLKEALANAEGSFLWQQIFLHLLIRIQLMVGRVN